MSNSSTKKKRKKVAPVVMDIPPRSAKSTTRFDRAKSAVNSADQYQEDHSFIPPAAMAVHAMMEAELANELDHPVPDVLEDQPVINPSLKVVVDPVSKVVPVADIQAKISSLIPPFMANRKK